MSDDVVTVIRRHGKPGDGKSYASLIFVASLDSNGLPINPMTDAVWNAAIDRCLTILRSHDCNRSAHDVLAGAMEDVLRLRIEEPQA